MMDTCGLEAEKCGEEMGRIRVKMKMKSSRERERERERNLSLSLQLQMQSADELFLQFAYKDSAVSVTKLIVR